MGLPFFTNRSVHSSPISRSFSGVNSLIESISFPTRMKFGSDGISISISILAIYHFFSLTGKDLGRPPREGRETSTKFMKSVTALKTFVLALSPFGSHFSARSRRRLIERWGLYFFFMIRKFQFVIQLHTHRSLSQLFQCSQRRHY